MLKRTCPFCGSKKYKYVGREGKGSESDPCCKCFTCLKCKRDWEDDCYEDPRNGGEFASGFVFIPDEAPAENF